MERNDNNTNQQNFSQPIQNYRFDPYFGQNFACLPDIRFPPPNFPNAFQYTQPLNKNSGQNQDTRENQT